MHNLFPSVLPLSAEKLNDERSDCSGFTAIILTGGYLLGAVLGTYWMHLKVVLQL